MLAHTNLNSAQDLSHKNRQSWTLLIRVSISLIVQVHGVDGVDECVVIWVETDLFFSVANAFWSPKVLKFYNQCPERPDISTVCCKSVFPKAIESFEIQFLPFQLLFWFFYFDDVKHDRETRTLIGLSW